LGKIKPFLLLIGLLLAGLYIFKKFENTDQSKPLHIFINESADHRFDESIQISIKAAFDRTKIQNAVVISDRFCEGRTLSEEAAQIFKDLKVGESNKGLGILYVYCPLKKELKIEVGYALEGVLTDAKVSYLEQAAKTFIYTDRFHDFWAELINTLNIEVQQSQNGTQAKEDGVGHTEMTYFSGGAGLYSKAYAGQISDLRKELLQLKSDEFKNYGPSDEPLETLHRYLESLESGIGDPSLPLLSEESRLFRVFTPMTIGQLKRNSTMYNKAGPPILIKDARVAFAFFKKNNPVLPIVLVKKDQSWYIQEPLSWSLFHRFEDSMEVYLKYPLKLNSVVLDQEFKTRFLRPLYHVPEAINLHQVLASNFDFTNSIQSESDFQSAYFKYFYLEKSYQYYSLNNKELSETSVWLALDTMINLGKMSEFRDQYSELAKRYPEDKILKKNAEFYKEVMQFDGSDWKRSF